MLRAAIPFTLLLNLCAAAAQPAANPELPKVDALIVQLGDNDQSAREAADLALRKIGIEAVLKMKAARAKTNDAEVQSRLDNLLKLFPPDRTALERKDVTGSNTGELTRKLYEEYKAECARLDEIAALDFMGGGADAVSKRKFVGPQPSNQGAILSDFAMVLGMKPVEALDAIAELDKDPKNVPSAPYDNVHVSPARFLGAAVRRAPYEAARKHEDSLAGSISAILRPADNIFDGENPPNAEQWSAVRKAIGELRELATIHASSEAPYTLKLSWNKNSMIFNEALLLDVLSTVAIQTEIRIFFDPVDLGAEMGALKVTQRFENVPADLALRTLLEPFKMKFRIEGEGQSQRVVIYRDTAKAPDK